MSTGKATPTATSTVLRRVLLSVSSLLRLSLLTSLVPSSTFFFVGSGSGTGSGSRSKVLTMMASAYGDGNDEPSPFLGFLERVKPPHSLVEPVTLASFTNVDAYSLAAEIAEEKDVFEAAFLQVVLHPSTLADETTRERTWSFSQSLGFDSDKLLAVHRWKIWWAIPRLLKGAKGEYGVPPQTYLLLGQRDDGNGGKEYLLMLPVVDKRMGFSLEGTGSNALLTISGYDNSANATDSFLKESVQEQLSGRQVKRRAVLISRGKDALDLVKRSMQLVKEYLRTENGVDRAAAHEQIQQRVDSIKAQRFQTGSFTMRRSLWMRGPGPAFVDTLGWCSWDSYYTDLDSDRVLRGIDSFNETGVVPRFVILDDGWQGTDVDSAANGKQWGGRLTSFNANFKFSPGYRAEPPEGVDLATIELAKKEGKLLGSLGDRDATSSGLPSLAPLITEAKAHHHIRHLLVWHTLSGYWAGVKPQGDFEEAYGAEIVFPAIPNSVHRASVADALKTEPFSTDGVGLVHPDKAAAFFADYHAELSAMGVDGVKVDAQSVLALLRGPHGGGWSLVQSFHAALKESISTSFGATDAPIIHCMCHSQDTLLNIASLYPDVDDLSQDPEASLLRPVIRGSDDFWPADPASHGPHLYANAINSLLFSHVALQDWDMFQTALGRTSQMHAAARAISGGPVYVSDQPDKHDGDLLRRMAFRDGAVPRCIRNARPPSDSLFLDPQRRAGDPLLLQNANPSGGLLIAAFSIAGAVLENDQDLFRFLSPDEMEWSHDGAKEQIEEWKRAHPSEAPREKQAFFDDPAWALHLTIDSSVGSEMVEEARAAVNHHANGPMRDNPDARPRWVAHRLSDGQLFSSDAVDAKQVPVHLERVFDFEVVSLARVQVVATSEGLADVMWGAAIGAVDKLNPGGAVLSFLVQSQEPEAFAVADASGLIRPAEAAEKLLRKGVSFEADLLGEGRYWFVTNVPNAQCRAEIVAAKALSGPDPEVSVTCRTVELVSGPGVEPETACLVELTVGGLMVPLEAQADAVTGVHIHLVVT